MVTKNQAIQTLLQLAYDDLVEQFSSNCGKVSPALHRALIDHCEHLAKSDLGQNRLPQFEALKEKFVKDTNPVHAFPIDREPIRYTGNT